MPEQVTEALDGIALALEIAGAGALVLGFLVATVQCARRMVPVGALDALAEYRRALGRVVVIGLEILVAATIIKTITIDPTWTKLGLLAVMIAIRTVLGWTMSLEIEGRWPWQKPPSPESAPTA